MTTHDLDKVISAAKNSRLAFQSDVMLSLDELEAFYAIAHEDGRKSVDTLFAIAEAYRCGEEAGRVDEREECAKMCESIDSLASSNPPMLCAKTIRARGDSK